MIVSAILAFLIGAIVLRQRMPRFATILSILAIAIFILVGNGIVPSLMVADLQKSYLSSTPISWGANNAIVVLGAGTEKMADASAAEPAGFAYGRLLRARGLYEDCKTHGRCTVIVSGGDPQHHGISEAAAYAATLIAAGVDQKDITLEDRSRTTWENAKFVGALLAHDKPDRTVLVTSAIHLKRSLIYFAHFGITPEPARGDAISTEPSLLPSGLNFAYCDIALHEYIGIARYHVYNLLGWNEPPVKI